jgi:hypothetical protein
MHLPDLLEVAAEPLQQVGVGAQLKAVDGGVAGYPPGPLPVVDDQELTRLLEEGGDVIDDHHIQVEEQGRAAQAVQIGAEGGEFGPAPLGQAGGQVERGDRQAGHLRPDALAAVGQADEAKGSAQMALHHRVEAIDVLGAVLAAPFHAQDDARIRRVHCSSTRCAG